MAPSSRDAITRAIELGTSVLQTYTAHPVLQANRTVAMPILYQIAAPPAPEARSR